uniref:SPARC related modular calcium binding 1 n=1 Tax=Sphaeramia orbicularis TaxID=375764 RepID=A0A673BAF4_9TELE
SLNSLTVGVFQPFLLTENMWPHGCVLDCQRGRHRAVCGTNGRLYKSMCAFQRAQCINSQLRPRRSKCQLARAQALEATTYSSSGGSHLNPAAAIFVPECSSDGHFLSVQCYNQTGYCWCSTPDGKPISGTSVLQLTPNCTDMLFFSLYFLVFADSPQTCERERAMLLSQMRSVWQEERFIPECTADGRYGAVQCHVATGYCWCVRADSGRPLPGTSVRPPPSSSPSRLDLLPSPPPPLTLTPEVVDSSRPEGVLRWHFIHLDQDSDGLLSEREARPLRQFLRRRLKPRRCAKKFSQYCDRDGDRSLTLEELRVGSKSPPGSEGGSECLPRPLRCVLRVRLCLRGVLKVHLGL